MLEMTVALRRVWMQQALDRLRRTLAAALQRLKRVTRRAPLG